MRACRSNPSTSAYEAVKGVFDINKTPIAPAGMRVVIHVKPSARGSWDTHGVEGFYIGPAMEHYRCYKVWALKTGALRVTDSLAWHPELLHMPGSSPMEALLAAITDLTNALKLVAETPQLAMDHQPLDAITTSLTQQFKELGAMFRMENQPVRDIQAVFQEDPPQPTTSGAPQMTVPTGANQRVIVHPPVPPGFSPLPIHSTVAPKAAPLPTANNSVPKQRVQTFTTSPVTTVTTPRQPVPAIRNNTLLPSTLPSKRIAKQRRHKDFEILTEKAMKSLTEPI
jgi:hypothetical protein